MNFRFTPKLGRQDPGEEEITFTIDRLWAEDADGAIDITHLLDQTYGYRPPASCNGTSPTGSRCRSTTFRLDRM